MNQFRVKGMMGRWWFLIRSPHFNMSVGKIMTIKGAEAVSDWGATSIAQTLVRPLLIWFKRTFCCHECFLLSSLVFLHMLSSWLINSQMRNKTGQASRCQITSEVFWLSLKKKKKRRDYNKTCHRLNLSLAERREQRGSVDSRRSVARQLSHKGKLLVS